MEMAYLYMCNVAHAEIMFGHIFDISNWGRHLVLCLMTICISPMSVKADLVIACLVFA